MYKKCVVQDRNRIYYHCELPLNVCEKMHALLWINVAHGRGSFFLPFWLIGIGVKTDKFEGLFSFKAQDTLPK